MPMMPALSITTTSPGEALRHSLLQGSESLEARYFPTSPEAVIEEHVLWSYCIQLASGLRAIHVRAVDLLLYAQQVFSCTRVEFCVQAGGRACRALDLSKVTNFNMLFFATPSIMFNNINNL